MDSYIVYVQIDPVGIITAINSSAFLSGKDGWVQIDEGQGDKYHHAQGHYLEKPLFDNYGRHNYKYVDGVIVEILEAEKPPIPTPEPSLEFKNRADIDYIGMMTGVL